MQAEEEQRLWKPLPAAVHTHAHAQHPLNTHATPADDEVVNSMLRKAGVKYSHNNKLVSYELFINNHLNVDVYREGLPRCVRARARAYVRACVRCARIHVIYLLYLLSFHY